MPVTQWNDEEDEALMGLPLLARVIYLQGLRRYMDFSTGIVGEVRQVSYQSLREVGYIDSCRGRRQAGSVSIKQIRVALESLEKVGLIKKISADRQLVFFCPLATVDHSDSKKQGRRRADVGQTQTGRPNGCDFSCPPNNLSNPKVETGQTPTLHNISKQGNPPESGIRLYQHSSADCPQTASCGPGTGGFASHEKCPHQQIIAIYHELLPNNPRVRTWAGRRPGILRSLWREHPDLDWFRGYLAYCSESPFLTGRVEGRNGAPPFIADLEWLLRPANFQKINEGKYHRGL